MRRMSAQKILNCVFFPFRKWHKIAWVWCLGNRFEMQNNTMICIWKTHCLTTTFHILNCSKWQWMECEWIECTEAMCIPNQEWSTCAFNLIRFSCSFSDGFIAIKSYQGAKSMTFSRQKASIYNRIIYRLGFMIRFIFNENQRYCRINTKPHTNSHSLTYIHIHTHTRR